MSKVKNSKFIFNWILINQLAVGTSPIDSENIIFLRKKKLEILLDYAVLKKFNGMKI